MSKIGNIGTLNDGVDTSVPGIEMVDLNDGDILARTSENVNPNGLFQFVWTPGDGSTPITSDWVDQEHKKKLTRVWVDGVKSAIIGRAQAKIQDAKDAAEEARAKKIRDEQFADPLPVVGRDTASVSKQQHTGAANPAQHAAYIQVASPMESPAPVNPADYIQDQLEIARERLRAAEAAQQDIIREVLNARRDYERWKALSSAIDGIDGSTGSDGRHTLPEVVEQAASPSRIVVADNRPGNIGMQGKLPRRNGNN